MVPVDMQVSSCTRLLGVLLIVILICFPYGYFVLNVDTNKLARPHDTEARGVGVYIINLDRAHDRYQYTLTNAARLGLPIERVVAIDGKLLSPAELEGSVDIKAYRKFLGHMPRAGTIGCSLSHIKAWKAFLASGYEFGIILEDDVKFDPVVMSKVIELLVHEPKLWDITSFDVSHRGMPLTIKRLGNTDYRLCVYLTEVANAGAYIINREAAGKLLAHALPIKMPVDHYYTRGWEFGFKFTGVEPRIAKQTYGDSIIGATANIDSGEAAGITTFERAAKVVYKLQSYLIRFVYNLAVYLKFSL